MNRGKQDTLTPWVATIPTHWQTYRLRFIAHVIFSNVDKHTLESEIPVRLCNYMDVYKNARITSSIEFMLASALPLEIERFQVMKGDVLLTKDSESPNDIAISALITEDLPAVLCGYHLAIVRPDKRKLCGAYLSWVQTSKEILAQYEARATGVTRFALGQLAFKDVYVPLPPLPEQCRIDQYLDGLTAKIDRLMELRRRQIALLKEQRAALIQQAVTRGLNPNAPMKDSGLPWLGEIPAHWRITRLKYLCSHIVDCLHSTPNYLPDGDYPAIRTADVVPGYIDTDNAKRLSHDDYLIQVQRLIPEEGDIVYSREGERFGIAACVPAGITLCISQRMMHFRVRRDVDSQFVMWQLNTKPVYSQAAVYVFGATSPHINVETITNYVLVEPPLGEQMEISGFIESGTAKLDLLHSAYARQLTLLTEYRAALIHECITGQRPLPEPSFPDGGNAHAL